MSGSRRISSCRFRSSEDAGVRRPDRGTTPRTRRSFDRSLPRVELERRRRSLRRFHFRVRRRSLLGQVSDDTWRSRARDGWETQQDERRALPREPHRPGRSMDREGEMHDLRHRGRCRRRAHLLARCDSGYTLSLPERPMSRRKDEQGCPRDNAHTPPRRWRRASGARLGCGAACRATRPSADPRYPAYAPYREKRARPRPPTPR
jgi:hypothetical protein